MFRLITTAILIGQLIANAAQASCLNSNADTRLRTLCVAETLAGSAVTLNDALLLDTLLKREGYAAGIGLPNNVARNSYEPYMTPILDYNTNINGGNPNRPLTLGTLTFTGDDENLKLEGVVAGLGAGIGGRSILGEGRYLDYGANISYAHSPEHDMGITRRSANICSRNHIENNWFFDGCADASGLERELAKDSTQGLTISTAKLFSTGSGAFHSTSVGVRRQFNETYEQNQIQLGWNTVRNKGAYTGFNASIGEAVPNQLAQRQSLSATVGTTVFDRALTATAAYSYADGGRLLGLERNDTTRSVSINYSVTTNFSVSVGYRETDSNIDYFSESEPTFSVRLAPIRF